MYGYSQKRFLLTRVQMLCTSYFSTLTIYVSSIETMYLQEANLRQATTLSEANEYSQPPVILAGKMPTDEE
jgi:hypothetical protein